MLSENDRIIYYGPLNVNLYPVTGIFRAYNPAKVQVDKVNTKTIPKALSYLNDLTYLNPKYINYHVPCVPAVGINMISETPENETDKGPDFVSTPLLKLPYDPEDEKLNGFYKGITSGHRSAIVCSPSGKFYRLKGCGNDLQGFIVQKTEGYIENIGIRGAQYECTAIRELYFAYHINEILKPLKIPVFLIFTLNRVRICQLDIGNMGKI